MRARVSVALVVTLVACLCALTGGAATAADPPRVLVFGDSISQGSSGDWAWRCRLWKHLVASGTPADLVGPRDDLWNWRDRVAGSTAYANPACDTDHASSWGMTFSGGPADLSDLVDAQRPDVVVGLIGLNDLLYGLATPQDLAQRWRTEVAQARTHQPDVSLVLVPVPDTWFTGVPQYNALLPSLAEELDTPASRVVVAASPGFQIARDTFDNSHPSANGEVRIAAVVADALAGLGVGTRYPRPLPVVAPGPAFAPTPRLGTAERLLRVAWPLAEYANAERVWVRDVTARTSWKRRTGDLAGTSWRAAAAGGHTYAVRLQPVKGRLASGTYSRVVQARVPARPRAVTGLKAHRQRGCRERFTWRPARFATGYAVLLRDVTTGGPWRVIRPGTVKTTAARTGRLARHRYAVVVRSYGPLRGGATRPVRFRACR